MQTPDGKPEVFLFVVDAGGGHRAAAAALAAAAEETDWSYRFRVVNLQTVLAPLDLLKRLFGVSMEEFYNLLLRRRFTGLLRPLLRVLHGLISVRRRALVGTLGRYLASVRPAAVVSVLPNFNGVIRDALRATHPRVPFLVLLTDLADLPPHFWIEPDVDRVIVGSEYAAHQARGLGLREDQVARVSGMVLHPRFHAAGGAATRTRLRHELRVPEEALAILILFGGKGSPEIEELSAGFLRASDAWHVVAMCGDNPRLLARIEALARGAAGRLHALGFTDRVADYMAACDLLVTKPGPASLFEAFARGLPVVVAENRDTIPMERFNARLVAEKQLGLVIRRWSEAPQAVLSLVRHETRLEHLRANVRALPKNRAVYEALAIIGRSAAARP